MLKITLWMKKVFFFIFTKRIKTKVAINWISNIPTYYYVQNRSIIVFIIGSFLPLSTYAEDYIVNEKSFCFSIFTKRMKLFFYHLMYVYVVVSLWQVFSLILTEKLRGLPAVVYIGVEYFMSLHLNFYLFCSKTYIFFNN